MSCEDLLRHLVEQNLSNFLYENAKFYAERLYSERNCDEHLHLLAQCYYRQGKVKQTYLVLQSSTWPANRYLFAMACVSLNKLTEGERALLPVPYGQPQSMSKEQFNSIPGGAAGIHLLGTICRKEHRKDAAIAYFKKSLQYDSSLWCSILELSEMGVVINVSDLFGVELNSAKQILGISSSPSTNVGGNENNANLLNINRPQASHGLIVGLEHKRLVENLASSSHSKVAMSLGLSSLSLRAPFASPGSMPIKPEQGGAADGAGRSATGSSSAGGAAGIHDYSLPSNMTNINSVGPHRAALFGISTPGFTPAHAMMHQPDTIPRGNMTNHLDISTNMEETMSTCLSEYINVPPSAVALRADGSSNRLPVSVIPNKTTFRSSLGSASDGGNRRVSFGPTARLSFSSIGGGDMDYEMSNLNDGIGNDDDFEGEQPMKMQRMGSGNSPNNISIDGLGSPIGITMTPTAAQAGKPVDAFGGGAAPAENAMSLPSPTPLQPGVNPGPDLPSGDLVLACLLVVLGNAYQLLCTYDCRGCIALLHSLPRRHFCSGWVHHLLGKAYCEVNDYKSALLALREMLRLEPFRVKGTETLSTALWHLKKDKELCSLAQQIVEIDKFAAEAWCVVGNCFSLQREPDAAIRFFQRALQINPSFPYAHTLCGHEYVNNEDLDKAISSFRSAILLDDRHYNAWYGLGSIYYRQEKYDLAKYHFRKALDINPSSSVLQCYLSMVLHAQDSPATSLEALSILTHACRGDAMNPQLRFQKAHILLSLERYEEALVELECVKQQVPREPPVYAMFGQIYHKLGMKQDALRNINIAIDLDPKEAVALKSLLDRIDEIQ